jgi:5-methylthioadenosine/S-adenosylhomocysteine deaminase
MNRDKIRREAEPHHAMIRRSFVVLALAVAATAAVAVLTQVPAPRRADLVITGGAVVTMDASRRVLWPGAVAIAGEAIVGVDTPERIAAAFSADDTMEATNHVVLPGLVNTHTHAPMVLYRGLADDLALMEWLEKYIFPAEAKTVSPEFVRLGAELAALEMIRSGTTAFADMYYFEEEIAKVTKAAGLRGVLGQSVIQFPVADAKTPADALARAERFIKSWKGDPLVVPAVAAHSMYTLDEATLTAARNLGTRYGVPVLIHLAETRDEVQIARDRHGKTPTGYLESIGFWTEGMLAAHGVWLDPEDIAILRRRGVAVSHNPESNMKLASGTAPVPRLREAGVIVGLGTDGAASNNDLDMFEAMRQAALLHKLQTGDPRVVGAPVVVEMATNAGATALGLADRIGSLEVGKKADVIVVAMDGPRQVPMYDPISHLAYVARGTDVRTTIVNGRTLMRDQKVLTMDEPRILAEARVMAGKIRTAVGKQP